MTLTRTLLAATTAIALSAGTASALGVTIGGTDFASFTGVGDFPSNNDYKVELAAAGVNSFYDAATLELVLGTSTRARLTFSEVFQESGAHSTFATTAGQSMSESSGGSGSPGTESFFFDLSANGQFENLLKFTSSIGGGTTFAGGTAGFGVYFDRSKGGKEFFLALDDGGAGEDDNHDDYIIKVNVVPLPAAAWLLLGVSGGLIAAKRRSARKAA